MHFCPSGLVIYVKILLCARKEGHSYNGYKVYVQMQLSSLSPGSVTKLGKGKISTFREISPASLLLCVDSGIP